MASPFQSVTVNSPSSDKASSAVTISSGRQTKPLDRERPEDTETRLSALLATRVTSAADRSFNWINELVLLTGGRLPDCLALSMWERLSRAPTTQVGRRTRARMLLRARPVA